LIFRSSAVRLGYAVYATVTPELASAQARRAEGEIAAGSYLGPLHGIPVAVKDICNTVGVVTAAGMAIHQ